MDVMLNGSGECIHISQDVTRGEKENLNVALCLQKNVAPMLVTVTNVRLEGKPAGYFSFQILT